MHPTDEKWCRWAEQNLGISYEKSVEALEQYVQMIGEYLDVSEDDHIPELKIQEAVSLANEAWVEQNFEKIPVHELKRDYPNVWNKLSPCQQKVLEDESI